MSAIQIEKLKKLAAANTTPENIRQELIEILLMTTPYTLPYQIPVQPYNSDGIGKVTCDPQGIVTYCTGTNSKPNLTFYKPRGTSADISTGVTFTGDYDFNNNKGPVTVTGGGTTWTIKCTN